MSKGIDKTVEIAVQGMTCGHCKATVEKAVAAVAGVSKVHVDLAGKKVSISFNPEQADEEALKQVISNEGYEVE